MAFRVIGFVVFCLLSMSQIYSDSFAECDIPKNIILVFGRAPRRNKDMDNFLSSPDVVLDDRSVYLSFPSKGVLKGCPENKKRSIMSVPLVFRYFLRNDGNGCNECEEMLKNSITSLLSWTKNVKHMSDAVVCNFFESRNEFLQTSDKQNMMDGSIDLSGPMAFQKAVGRVRKGILERILDVFGFGSPDEDRGLLRHSMTPSIENLLRMAVEQVSVNPNGYLVVITGGELQDPFDPKKSPQAEELDQALLDALKYTDKKNTLVIVTGQCPDGNDENTEVPVYATGPGSKFIVGTKLLWDLPHSIHDLLEDQGKQQDKFNSNWNWDFTRKSRKKVKNARVSKGENKQSGDTKDVKTIDKKFKYDVDHHETSEAPPEFQFIPLTDSPQKKEREYNLVEDEFIPIELKDIESQLKYLFENPDHYKKPEKKRRSLDDKMKGPSDILKDFGVEHIHSSELPIKFQDTPLLTKQSETFLNSEIPKSDDGISTSGKSQINMSTALLNHKELKPDINENLTFFLKEFGNISDDNHANEIMKSEKTLKLSDKENKNISKDSEILNNGKELNEKSPKKIARYIKEDPSENGLESKRIKTSNEDVIEIRNSTTVTSPELGRNLVTQAPDSLITGSLLKLVQMVKKHVKNKTRSEKELEHAAENTEIEKLLLKHMPYVEINSTSRNENELEHAVKNIELDKLLLNHAPNAETNSTTKTQKQLEHAAEEKKFEKLLLKHKPNIELNSIYKHYQNNHPRTLEDVIIPLMKKKKNKPTPSLSSTPELEKNESKRSFDIGDSVKNHKHLSSKVKSLDGMPESLLNSYLLSTNLTGLLKGRSLNIEEKQINANISQAPLGNNANTSLFYGQEPKKLFLKKDSFRDLNNNKKNLNSAIPLTFSSSLYGIVAMRILCM